MKLKLVILLCCVGNLTAGPIFSQSPKLDVAFENKTVLSVLNELKTRTGYIFFHMDGVIPEDLRVTLEMNDATLMQILDKVLVEKGYSYRVEDKLVIISAVEKQSTQQPRMVSVSGTVSDRDGRLLPGVTVVVKGTTRGMATGVDGRYTVSVRPQETLIFSFIGKQSVEVVFSGQASIDVRLEDSAAQIEDVVVTGIFNRPRESYTGAVSTITEKELKMYRGQNMLATLRNIDPAINIVADNFAGSNPNREMEINIRGNSSLPMNIDDLQETVGRQLNTPLVIMDGFEITLQKLMDFNDEEIESINILKDASATSIYGSRGANGVIVIKTRSPQPGRLRIFVQAGLNLEIPDLSSYDLLGAKDKLTLERMVGLYDVENDPDLDRVMKEIYNRRWAEALRGGTDWLREPVRVGTGQRLNLRLEGGSDEFRWSATVGNNATRGAIKGSQRNTTTASITLSYQFKNLIFRNQASYDYTLADNGTYLYTLPDPDGRQINFSTYARMQPYNRARDENGDLIERWQGWSSTSYIYNPLVDAALNSKNESRIHTISDIFSVDWNVTEGLNIRGQVGFSKSFNREDVYLPAENTYFQNLRRYATGEDFFRKGYYDYTDGEAMSIDGMLTLSYTKTFNEKHVLYAGLSGSIARSESNSYIFRTEGLLNQDFNDLSNALQYAQGTIPSGADSRTSRIGFTGNVNYTYDNRYFVDATFRLDGSSQFGTNNKYAPFWSLGTGWNIHNEKFMKDQKVVNMLRLRLAYGQTGSQQFSAYQARSMYRLLTSTRYLFWSSAELMGLGNEDLKWQRTDQWNVGVDAQLLENRLSLGFDVYYKNTVNLLSSVDIPQAQGFRSYAENVGEVRNYGFEAMLGGYILRNTERGLLWNVSARLTYTKNEVTKLSPAIKEQVETLRQTSEFGRLLYEGRAQNSIYAVRSLGIDPMNGQEIFLDKNGNVTNTWSAADRVYCGVGEPAYRGTLSSLFSYKDFSVNLSFAYHWGGKQYNQTLIDKVEVTNSFGANGVNIKESNVDRRVFTERWQQPGDIKFFKGYGNSLTRSSTRFVMDDSVFELQSVSLQYRWHTPFVQKNLRAETVNFSINMSDVFYISSIKRERGIDYPFARNIQMAISLTF